MPKRGYGDDVGSTSVKKTKTGGGYAKGLANKIKSSKTGNGYAKGMAGKAKAEENDRERQSLKKGDAFWELSNKRRLTVTEFSGKPMVDIREYYEKDDESLPGKKGIMLSMEQFNAAMTALPDILEVMIAKGLEVEMPDLTAMSSGARNDVKDEDEDSEDSDEEVEVEKPKKSKKEDEEDEEVDKKIAALPSDDEKDTSSEESE